MFCSVAGVEKGVYAWETKTWLEEQEEVLSGFETQKNTDLRQYMLLYSVAELIHMLASPHWQWGAQGRPADLSSI